MKNYNDIPPNYKISVPMVYNHAIRVLDRLDRRLSRLNTPTQPLKASGWQFEIIYSQQEMELMERKPPKLLPTPEQINIWEHVVLDWFTILEPEELRLAWKRVNHIPWKFLCREFGYGRAEMWRRFHRVLIKISFYLKGKNVGDKKV